MKFIIILSVLSVLVAVTAFAKETNMKQIRTYLPYSIPIDPARIMTISDMDLSYALASTLVRWDSNKQIERALAVKWETISEKVYRFTLKSDLKWSNGYAVKSSDVKASFERSMKAYPDDLRSLISMVDHLECPSDNQIDFILKKPSPMNALLGKVAEANYGLLKSDLTGKIDTSITSGPFYISAQTENELVLKRNPFWIDSNTEMSDEVLIRKPSSTFDAQKILFTDEWANLAEASSLMSESLSSQYRTKEFKVWQRPVDKLFLFRMSHRIENEEGYKLFRFLRTKIHTDELVKNLSGYQPGDQLFPKGYHLFDPNFRDDKRNESLPDQFKHRPIEVMLSRARVSSELQENIRALLRSATGIEPKFIEIAMSDYTKKRLEGHFDIYAGTVGLADPDPEGAMSFYLDNNPPVVAKGDGKYVKLLDEARHENNPEKRVSLYRKILTDSTHEGRVLPLFHLSTVGIGRPELDFSKIPLSEESVTLSKVRFNGAK